MKERTADDRDVGAPDVAYEAGTELAGGDGRDTFGGFVGPRTLLEIAAVGAPYVFDGTHPREEERHAAASGSRSIELGDGPLGWWRILRADEPVPAAEKPTPAEIADYFALCCAAHFATAASWVPTDVDAKVRRALWLDQSDDVELDAMSEFALRLTEWDLTGFTARDVVLDPAWGVGTRLSGHDGEALSVLAGALIASLARGDEDGSARLEQAIVAELDREARAFAALAAAPGRELDWVRAAGLLTHNAGDVNQGLDTKEGRRLEDGARIERFLRLAQGDEQRYGGQYGRAGRVYRELLAPEGHRNYPLRKVQALRRDPRLLLTIPPFLDEWGALVATTDALSPAERAQVVAALLEGCSKIAGQEAYYRALAGFDEAHPGGLGSKALAEDLPASARRRLKDSELRRRIAIPRSAFESGYVKRARAAARPK